MLFPTIFVNNFLDNPEDVVEYAKTLEYTNDGDSPGKRSTPLHIANYHLYNSLNLKILSVLFPSKYKEICYEGTGVFQWVPSGLRADGWVHSDTMAQLTAIIYLSKDVNAGTEIFVPNTTQVDKTDLATNEKYEYFKNTSTLNTNIQTNDETYINHKNEFNNRFKKVASFSGEYNSLVAFDSFQYHAAQVNMSGLERYTYIMFFDKIYSKTDQLLYPIPTSRRL